MPCTVTPARGRLVFLTVSFPLVVEDVQMMAAKLRDLMPTMPPPGTLFATDLTRCKVVSPDVTVAFTSMMRADNKYLFRAALLIATEGAFALQVERLVREAAFPSRRVFRQRKELIAWLEPVMNEPERQALAGPWPGQEVKL